MATIGLLGDVMLGRGVAAALADGAAPEELWSAEVRRTCAECDLVVCNLECCLSEGGRRTELLPGKPFFFRGPPAAARSLRAVGVSAVTLANNHALDFGEEALADTLRHLEDAEVVAAGAGPGEAEARRGRILEAGGLRLGLLAVADHPASYAAGPARWGTAYADLRHGLPPWLLEELERLRRRTDLVLVAPHWGPNMTVGPERWQRRHAAQLVAAGADMVAGHSAHVFHGVERRPGGLVLYDLGDALDDYAVDPELRNDLGVLALWHPGEAPDLELVGLKLEFVRTELAHGADAEWIAARLLRACAELGSEVERVAEQRFRLR
jgi:poly-gamma-glutamate capsule biosynthesis protein CapA/YwtB (metallophosphatase superfamily)